MRYQGSIVKQMLKIIEEGPAPMRDFKPAETVRTGAEMFHEDHKGFVVSDHSVDWIQMVEEHNSTHPKLKGELDKRRSTGKVTALTADKMDTYCSKRKSIGKPKAAKFIRRRKANVCIGSCRGKRIGRTRMRRLNGRCLCPRAKMARNKKSGRNDILTFDLSISASKRFAPTDVVFLKNQTKVSDDAGSVKSLYRNDRADDSDYGIDSQNPDTSVPSISSYNSFGSTDHEPMI